MFPNMKKEVTMTTNTHKETHKHTDIDRHTYRNKPMADPGFPRDRERQLSRGEASKHDFAKISPKLHKIEGGRPLHIPIDPPM